MDEEDIQEEQLLEIAQCYFVQLLEMAYKCLIQVYKTLPVLFRNISFVPEVQWTKFKSTRINTQMAWKHLDARTRENDNLTAKISCNMSQLKDSNGMRYNDKDE